MAVGVLLDGKIIMGGGNCDFSVFKPIYCYILVLFTLVPWEGQDPSGGGTRCLREIRVRVEPLFLGVPRDVEITTARGAACGCST